jgi:Domain of unknown function (DUF4262)
MSVRYPSKIPKFAFRDPKDEGDVKLLADVRAHGFHVVAILDDEEGPGFAFTVGVYLRTLRPEILIMGIPPDPAHRVLNAIAQRVVEGEALRAGKRYEGFADGKEVMFRPIHESQFPEYLGYAGWFYRSPFPAIQCVWPDLKGLFPHEPGFDPRFVGRQIDLSIPLSARRSKPPASRSPSVARPAQRQKPKPKNTGR